MTTLEIANLSVIPPLMSQSQFALFTGVTADTVRGWVENSTIPTVKIGKQRFINIKLLSGELEQGKTIFVQGDYRE